MNRRHFLQLAGSSSLLLTTTSGWAFGKKGFHPSLGVCAAIDQNGILKEAGYQFVEESVGRFLMPGKDATSFAESLKALKGSSLSVLSCNSFIPGNLKSVGESVQHEEILIWAETAFLRALQAGIKYIVFGSGGSRKIPDDFPRDKARTQFLELIGKMAPVAQRYQVTIALEHLNSGETNFINSVSEANELVNEIDHPNFKILCDIFHMMREKEGPEAILKAGKNIVHCHIAENTDRAAPGVNREDFVPYLKALKKVGYSGGISIECNWKNEMEKQLAPSYHYMVEQLKQV